MEKERLYRRAEQKWGMFFQSLMVLEETAELSMELTRILKMPLMHRVAEKQFEQCKSIRNGYVSNDLRNLSYTVSDNLVEEIADVEIMLEQMKTMHKIKGRVEKKKEEKLDRLANLLDTGLNVQKKLD
jgi:hypothetical protein